MNCPSEEGGSTFSVDSLSFLKKRENVEFANDLSNPNIFSHWKIEKSKNVTFCGDSLRVTSWEKSNYSNIKFPLDKKNSYES
jgi:hypothetical protein